MSFEPAFKSRFSVELDNALSSGLQGSWVEGCAYGIASALIYVAEAILFVFGAYLISHQIYTYLQMVQVLNLLVFSITIGSQLISFSKSKTILAYQRKC